MKLEYIWKIDRFTQLPHINGQPLVSEKFGDRFGQTKWSIALYPKGYSREDNNWVSIFLQSKELNGKVLPVKKTFAIIDGKQRKINEHVGENDHTDDSSGWGFPKFISREKLFEPKSAFVNNDSLKIFCRIEFKSNYEKTKASLITSIEKLFNNENKSDLTIEVNGKIFFAHKLILGIRSPVLDKMFEHEMKENKESRLVINDINEKVFEQFLSFIYTGEFDDKDIKYEDLFVVADKYDLQDLRDICKEVIRNQLSVETVSDVLVLADMHSADDLKSKAIDFIANNAEEVVKSEGWKRVAINADLVSQCFLAVVPKLNTKN